MNISLLGRSHNMRRSRTGRPESTNPSMWQQKLTPTEEEMRHVGMGCENCSGYKLRRKEFKDAVRKFREITNKKHV